MMRQPNQPNDPNGLHARSVSAAYGPVQVLRGVDLAVARGTITALVGPNGSGKSTLLRVCSRLLAPDAGGATLDGQDIARIPTRELARRLAILPQSPATPVGITVRELVEQGRYPHVGPLRALGRHDHAAIDRAIARVELHALADRDVDTLSGGERQRAWIALTLAQETGVLALDEPTTFLDIGHQLEILELVRRLNVDAGLTVLMTLHDLNHAAHAADHLVVLDRGAVVAAGAPWSIVEPGLLRRVFGVDASIVEAEGRRFILVHRANRPEPP